MKTRLAAVCFACALSLVLIVPNSFTEQLTPDRVIIVLDASGSMWGQVTGRAKIDIAKEVIRDLVKDWDPGVHLGLTVYGHRRKGDCSDIEALIPVGVVNKKRFTAVLDGISPKGKTPFSAAVIQAARELKYAEDRASVIVVSDGIETCGMDPCAVGKDLEKKKDGLHCTRDWF